jgi:hypothetical protein
MVGEGSSVVGIAQQVGPPRSRPPRSRPPLTCSPFCSAEDELDWPQCSWGSGFHNASQCPYPFKLGEDEPYKQVGSIYARMRERNRCNHRDYQNIGVNGMRMTAASDSKDGLAIVSSSVWCVVSIVYGFERAGERE